MPCSPTHGLGGIDNKILGMTLVSFPLPLFWIVFIGVLKTLVSLSEVLVEHVTINICTVQVLAVRLVTEKGYEDNTLPAKPLDIATGGGHPGIRH